MLLELEKKLSRSDVLVDVVKDLFKEFRKIYVFRVD